MPRALTGAGLLFGAMAGPLPADEVRIQQVDLRRHGALWSVAVTLHHGDSGWDHYADEWRVVDGAGRVLGRRVLHHPHVDEQPFTRGLGQVAIPADTHQVYVEAHDNFHGWSSQRVAVDLRQAQGPGYRIEDP
jgi:hypothetical protein